MRNHGTRTKGKGSVLLLKVLIVGGVGVFGFSVLTIFLAGFFGSGVCYGLWFLLLLAFGFRFSARLQAVFRIWYPTWFLVFPIFEFSFLFGRHQ